MNDLIDKHHLFQKSNIENHKNKEIQLQQQIEEANLNYKNEKNLKLNLELKVRV